MVQIHGESHPEIVGKHKFLTIHSKNNIHNSSFKFIYLDHVTHLIFFDGNQ